MVRYAKRFFQIIFCHYLWQVTCCSRTKPQTNHYCGCQPDKPTASWLPPTESYYNVYDDAAMIMLLIYALMYCILLGINYNYNGWNIINYDFTVY